MSKFTIDFFELSFLAEACIPPRPIARTMFWQNLTDVYWQSMSESQRSLLFTWIQRNAFYQESLDKEEDTQIFHARFDPDNQYEVTTDFKGKIEVNRTFKRNDEYWLTTRSLIAQDYITDIKKLDLTEAINKL